jgi:YVTN family beta-propeller protein
VRRSAPGAWALAALVATIGCLAGVQQAQAEGPREAFVTNQLADSVSVIELASMRQVGEVKVSGRPAGVAFA